jgi:hypothetical protein
VGDFQVAIGGQGMDGAGLIITHEAAVTFNVCAEDGCELTFKTFLRHRKSPFIRFHIENVCNSGVLLILLIAKGA